MATTTTRPTLAFTGDPKADRLISDDPLALLIGLVLDQQVRLEKAFYGPFDLEQRLGHLDPRRIAEMDPAAFEAIFRQRPMVHRFPGSMARRVQALCSSVANDYRGDASQIWMDATDSDELARRIGALPGFGPMKVRTLVTILAKRLNVRPAGWERHGATHMSLADVDGARSLEKYREFKRLQKSAASRERSTSRSR